MTHFQTSGSADTAVVMLADDDMFIRTLLRGFLPESSVFIDVADGDGVMPAYKEKRPDIVFLDMHMPGRDGKQIVKDILEHDPKAYVIIISADASRENVSASVISGAMGFMVKPLDKKRILQEYTKALKNRV